MSSARLNIFKLLKDQSIEQIILDKKLKKFK